jgi:methionyl-tRNA formyltransferase
MSKKLKIAFMGTPDFAATALQALIDSDHDVVAAYSQPPRPKGRGHKVQKSPVHILAEENGIAVYTPQSFKKEPEAVTIFEGLELDIAVVAAYGLLLPQSILDAPKYGCLNIHGSILPRWRGAAPIQRAILAGDTQSGITIMQMDIGLDTGAMISKETTPITRQTTAQSLHDDLAEIGSRLVVEALDVLANTGALESESQNDDDANYAHRLSRDDGRIDWTQPADAIERQMRSLTPWPGIWCLDASGKRMKIHDLSLVETDTQNDGAGGHPCGALLDKSGLIVCGENTVLKIGRLQPENAKAMDVASALNGGYIAIGDVFQHSS